METQSSGAHRRHDSPGLSCAFPARAPQLGSSLCCGHREHLCINAHIAVRPDLFALEIDRGTARGCSGFRGGRHLRGSDRGGQGNRFSKVGRFKAGAVLLFVGRWLASAAGVCCWHGRVGPSEHAGGRVTGRLDGSARPKRLSMVKFEFTGKRRTTHMASGRSHFHMRPLFRGSAPAAAASAALALVDADGDHAACRGGDGSSCRRLVPGQGASLAGDAGLALYGIAEAAAAGAVPRGTRTGTDLWRPPSNQPPLLPPRALSTPSSSSSSSEAESTSGGLLAVSLTGDPCTAVTTDPASAAVAGAAAVTAGIAAGAPAILPRAPRGWRDGGVGPSERSGTRRMLPGTARRKAPVSARGLSAMSSGMCPTREAGGERLSAGRPGDRSETRVPDICAP